MGYGIALFEYIWENVNMNCFGMRIQEMQYIP